MFRVKMFITCIIAVVIIVGGFLFISKFDQNNPSTARYQTAAEKNIYVRFGMEAYDTIIKNYWAATSTYSLPKLFQASLAKATNGNPMLATEDRVGTANMLSSVFATGTSTEAQKQQISDMLQIVLYNLQPAGRSSLNSLEEVTALRQEVSNVNPKVNLYDNLGVTASSSETKIKEAYEEKIAPLKNATSSADKVKAKEVTHAYEVLSNTNAKSLYDKAKIEPTASKNIIDNTLYVQIAKMSPTTVQEFAWTVDAASTSPNVNTMIIDLRGNIGGDLNVARGLTSLFIGNNQYAFDLFHQGDYDVQRTLFGKFDELDKYKEIAVLTDNMTQSTAEVLTQVLTHFKIAHSVGQTTRGWGTVEDTYPLATMLGSTKYFLKLVNSVTLRGDGQPIEGRGVTPDVDTSQANWKTELRTYFSSPSLIKAIEDAVEKGR